MWRLDFPQFGRFEARAYEVRRVAIVAREIRKACSQARREPFDPFAAAQKLGIEVRIVSMAHGDEGQIRFDLPGLTIEISDAASPLRQRFTLCHELAHLSFIEHKPWLVNSDQPDSHAEVDRREEFLCNSIAAELLMPERAFKRRARGMTPGFLSASDLAKQYQVSIAAVVRQLERTHSWSIARASWEIHAGIVSQPRLRRVVMRSKLRKAKCIRAKDEMLRAFEIAGARLGRDRNGSRELTNRLDAGAYVVVETPELAVTAVLLGSNPYIVGGTIFS